MAGWHHRLDGHGFGWTPGVGDGQGGLVCCSPWGLKESDMTELLNNSACKLLLRKPAPRQHLFFLPHLAPQAMSVLDISVPVLSAGVERARRNTQGLSLNAPSPLPRVPRRHCSFLEHCSAEGAVIQKGGGAWRWEPQPRSHTVLRGACKVSAAQKPHRFLGDIGLVPL